MIYSEAQKKAVPKSKRGLPSKSGTGSYPMGDREHAGIAVALAAMHHGKNSSFTRKIRRRAHALYPAMKKLSDLK